MGRYQYKIVIVCAGSSWFRGGDLDGVLEELNKIKLTTTNRVHNEPAWRSSIKTQEDLDYAFKLQNKLSKLTDIEVRVESPWISVYTNTKSNINELTKLDADKVKYISCPPSSRRQRTTSGSPYLQAFISAVNPRAFVSTTDGPLSINFSATTS